MSSPDDDRADPPIVLNYAPPPEQPSGQEIVLRTIAGIAAAFLGLLSLGFIPWIFEWIRIAVYDRNQSERALGRLNAPVCALIAIIYIWSACRWGKYAICGCKKHLPAKQKDRISMISHVGICMLALLVLTFAASASAATTVGDPTNPVSLETELNKAYESGAREIVVRPGVYILPATGKDSIVFNAWKDAVVDAQGVTIVFQELHHRPLLLRQCQRVVFEGATLRFAVPAFTQGRIVQFREDLNVPYIDWQIDAGYPIDLDEKKPTFDVVDQNTRSLRIGTGDFGPSAMTPIGPRTFRLLNLHGNYGAAKIGDWLFTRISTHGSSIVQLDRCDHCTMRKITLQNAGFAAFFDTEGEGGNLYQDCKVQPGPKPEGASEEQLVGCGADGFHSVGTRVGPTIDHCAWEGLLHDDCIAIHGSLQKIESAAGSTLVLEKGNRGGFVVGEPVRVSSKTGFFQQFNCTAMKKLDDGKPELTLDQPYAGPSDAQASNPNHNGAGYKIIHCTLGGCRSRGILVKADHGLIEDNTITGCGMSAISIGPEYYWHEADYCWDVTVRNNRLISNVRNGSEAGTVFIHGDGCIGNRNIVINDNVFDQNYGQIAVHIEDTDGAQITGNRFIGSPITLAGMRHRIVLDLERSRNIRLSQNHVSGMSADDVLVRSGKGVEGLTGNDANGMTR